jgi:CheY-like chemotaxis protein
VFSLTILYRLRAADELLYPRDWWVAKQIRKQSYAKRPFLIAMTGYGRQTDQDRSYEVGIDLHLVNPVEPDTLQQILRRFQTVGARRGRVS